MPIKISCIIVSCDSENKGNCIYHCLQSILNQNYSNFEIIIIENSHKNKLTRIKELKKYLSEASKNHKRKINCSFSVGNKSFNLNYARNKAAQKASGDVLVFMEDDTILIDRLAFRKISNYAKNYDFGYGAMRLWTKNGWFNKKSDAILSNIKRGQYDILRSNAGHNNPNTNKFIDLLGYTFIANFGFCKAGAFKKVGGFPIYNDLDWADDCLMFRLYEKYKYKFLGSIKVVHIMHYRDRNSNSISIEKYFNELVSKGYYWFHVNKTFQRIQPPKNEILEKLKAWHPDYRLEMLYDYYKRLRPLDIKKSKDLKSWIINNQLSRLDFIHQVNLILKSKNIDEYIKESRGDFDNLALVIKTLLKYNFLIVSGGKLHIKNRLLDKLCDCNKKFRENNFTPNNKLNQFPCDLKSRLNRYKLIMSKYGASEYLKFGFIGDDDLVSILFSECKHIYPIVLEKDKRIINLIKRFNNQASIIEFDLAKIKKHKDNTQVQSFMTDPPYTLHGSLAFIYAGLEMLPRNDELKEFYVILNQTMMGRNLLKLIKILAQAEICLFEVMPNFSTYKLPTKFKEYERMIRFANNNKLDKNKIEYSSSSNLYIFRTHHPNLKLLMAKFKTDKLYTHYL